jgi:hypothetical protein
VRLDSAGRPGGALSPGGALGKPGGTAGSDGRECVDEWPEPTESGRASGSGMAGNSCIVDVGSDSAVKEDAGD